MRLLAAGRDADVFAHGDGLVLRRYRDGRSVGAEGDLMRTLADLGYPVPAVVEVSGPDLVLARVDGPTLGRQVLDGDVAPAAAGRVLARLLDDLHALPAPDGGAHLHLDLHPFNVLVGPSGPVVIDWCNARVGEPGLDVAMSALILAQVALQPSMLDEDDLPAQAPALITGVLRGLARHVRTPYADHLDAVADRRRADRHVSAEERELLGAAVDLARSVA